MKIELTGGLYVYENAFKNDDGDLIEYSQLRQDVKIGDKVVHLSYKLRGFESEFVKDLISAQNVFNENDITE